MSRIIRKVDSGWSWVVLVAAIVSQFVYGAIVYPFSVYLVAWQKEFGLGASEASVIVSELSFTTHIVAIFGGALCKRFGCRAVLLVTSGVATVSTFLTSFATQTWHLHIYTVVIGCTMGIVFIGNVVILTYYFKKHIGIANGFVYGSVVVGGLSMSPSTEFLCEKYGWKGSLMIFSGIVTHMIFSAAVFRPTYLENESIANSKAPLGESRYDSVATDRKRSENPVDCPTGIETEDFAPSKKSSPKACLRWLRFIDKIFDFSALLKNVKFCVFLLSSTITTMCLIAFRYFMPSKLVYDIGVSTFDASLSITVYCASSVVIRFANGIIIDAGWVSASNLFIFTMAVIGTSAIVTPLTKVFWVQLLVMALAGLGSGNFYPLVSIISRELVPMEKVPNAIGWIFGIGGVGAIIASLIMGQLYDLTGSYNIPFFIVGIFQLVAIIVMIVASCIGRRRRRNNDIRAGDSSKIRSVK